ncbi:hypothetical protein Y1Q_0012514 [Alligator mississippiensis]|uniref:Fibrillin 1 unique N-terminal domain-containing protein n=1 Tax=Alligator mississippiensis TaxID=8496 RepID=A0A151M7X6_ALLMI|nr:hypothetical protein Y1Q_0012514 [Alligator mississippiensis]
MGRRRRLCVLWLACVALWAPGAAGGQSKPPRGADAEPREEGAGSPATAARVRRRGQQDVLRGPNVCGSRFHSYCCPGWKTLPGGNQCIVRMPTIYSKTGLSNLQVQAEPVGLQALQDAPRSEETFNCGKCEQW